jgi:hypothetical protein
MKKIHTEELSLRVYNNIAEKQLDIFFLGGKPMTETEELILCVTENLNDCINSEERKKVLLDKDDEISDLEIRTIILKVAIKLAVLYVKTGIKKTLATKGFGSVNPYTVST